MKSGFWLSLSISIACWRRFNIFKDLRRAPLDSRSGIKWPWLTNLHIPCTLLQTFKDLYLQFSLVLQSHPLIFRFQLAHSSLYQCSMLLTIVQHQGWISSVTFRSLAQMPVTWLQEKTTSGICFSASPNYQAWFRLSRLIPENNEAPFDSGCRESSLSSNENFRDHLNYTSGTLWW